MPFLLGLQRIMIPKNSSQKRHFKKALCPCAHPYILFRALLHNLFLISDFHFWNQFFLILFRHFTIHTIIQANFKISANAVLYCISVQTKNLA